MTRGHICTVALHCIALHMTGVSGRRRTAVAVACRYRRAGAIHRNAVCSSSSIPSSALRRPTAGSTGSCARRRGRSGRSRPGRGPCWRRCGRFLARVSMFLGLSRNGTWGWLRGKWRCIAFGGYCHMLCGAFPLYSVAGCSRCRGS
jgi:hypothetical protein